MNSTEMTISAGALSMLFLEGIKILVRLLSKKPDYDFSPSFYSILLPVLNALMPFAMVAIGIPSDDPVLTMTWQGVGLYVLRVAIMALISLVSYNQGLKPMKEYAKRYNQLP